MKTSLFIGLLAVVVGLGTTVMGGELRKLPWSGKIWDKSGKAYEGIVVRSHGSEMILMRTEKEEVWLHVGQLNASSLFDLGLGSGTPIQSPAVVAEVRATQAVADRQAQESAKAEDQAFQESELAAANRQRQLVTDYLARKEAEKGKAEQAVKMRRDSETLETLQRIEQELVWARMQGR